jgi:hypothetical protein
LLIYPEQPFEKLRHKTSSLRIDEATDCNGIGHLIDYVRYVEDTTINEDMPYANVLKESNSKRTLENC